MSKENQNDPFYNLINCFREFKFKEFDTSGFSPELKPGQISLINQEKAMNYLSTLNPSDFNLSEFLSKNSSQKAESDICTGNNSPRGHESPNQNYFRLSGLDHLEKDLHQGLSVMKSPVEEHIKNQFEPPLFYQASPNHSDFRNCFHPCMSPAPSSHCMEEGPGHPEEKFMELERTASQTQPADPTECKSEANAVESVVTKKEERGVQKEYYFLFANPSQFLYTKMSKERQHYISQIVNGTVGIFLGKPDWKILLSTFELSELRKKIFLEASRIFSMIENKDVPYTEVNTKMISELLPLSKDSNVSEETAAKLHGMEESVRDNLSKNFYGKKNHSYKISKLDELQKALIINESSDLKEEGAKMYFKLCLRVLFHHMFTDKDLYEALIDKIAEHVRTEVDKKKKDTNEKLPSLKKSFYKVNKDEFSQKFLDPPSNLRSVKATFKYAISNDDSKDIALDFYSMVNRLNPENSAQKIEDLKIPTVYYTEAQKDLEPKKDELWVAFPFMSQDLLQKTSDLLKQRSIGLFKANIKNEEPVDLEKETWIEISPLKAKSDIKLKFRVGEEKVKQIEFQCEDEEMKKAPSGKGKIVLQSSVNQKRNFNDLEI